MSLTRRIQHLALAIACLVVVVSWGAIRWPLFRPYEPTAVDPFEAVQLYGLPAEAEGSPGYYQYLPPALNQRTTAYLQEIRRGAILDRTGRILAYDENDLRQYDDLYAAQVVGYVSGIGTGMTGIEYGLNDILLGATRLENRWAGVTHQPQVGNDVYLTIDYRLQAAAAEILGLYAGAIVVMDAHTGAIYALYSNPVFDANRLLNEAGYGAYLTSCTQGFECGQALYNRAAQGAYAPGSIWKTVTLIAALESGQATPETTFVFSGTPWNYAYSVDGVIIEDHNHAESSLNLEGAYAWSANAAFAQLGVEMDPSVLIAYAEKLGFSPTGDNRPPVEIPAAAGQLATDVERLKTDRVLRAWTAIGQGELLASPLNMALVVASVVNGGDMPRPHLVDHIATPSGRAWRPIAPANWSTNVMHARTAQTVKEMMQAVVTYGTGEMAAIDGYSVGGKTGTAEVQPGWLPHAWFVGFVENEGVSLAIAVVAENGGEGALVAAPMFAEIGRAALALLSP